MSNRLTRITTGKGDKGMTSTAAGKRCSKHDLEIEVIGTIDELNAALGLTRAALNGVVHEEIFQIILKIQNQLFNLGAAISLPEKTFITNQDVAFLEQCIESFNAHLPPLKEFVIPGENQASSCCHFARCVARRAERRLVALASEINLAEELLVYVNRLSDLLFVISRILAREQSEDELQWQK